MQDDDTTEEVAIHIQDNLKAAVANQWPKPHPMPIYAGGRGGVSGPCVFVFGVGWVAECIGSGAAWGGVGWGGVGWGGAGRGGVGRGGVGWWGPEKQFLAANEEEPLGTSTCRVR